MKTETELLRDEASTLRESWTGRDSTLQLAVSVLRDAKGVLEHIEGQEELVGHITFVLKANDDIRTPK